MWMSWIVIHFRMFLRTMQWSNHCVRWQVFLVGVFVGLRPLFLCLVCCFFWRNASLAGGFAGRLAGWCFVCLIVICLSRLIWSLYKLYKSYKLTFYRLCSCKDRATVRHRPHSREKKMWRRGTLRGRRGTNSHLLSFQWQAWHKLTPTIVSRGRRGTNSHLLSFCVAGVAQPDIHLRFTWQAWHKLTSTVVLRGRRGTHGTGYGEHTIALIAEPGGTRRKRSNLLTNNLPYIPTYMTYIHTYLHTYIHSYLPTFSIFLRPRYNLWSSLLEEVDLWGYPVL